MTQPRWNSILRQVRRIGLPHDGGDLSDGTLLHRFVANRDEDAFAALVGRHGPMVWALCRRILHNLPDAEDAFQATFLVLVRKANSIRQPDLLGPWLHGVAFRVAMRLRAAIGLRAGQQGDLELPAPEAMPDAERKELRLLLDQEVSRLPERYRMPFVLCHLEGLTNEEAARRLRCPKGTILSRLSRARERLRLRLTRRGVGLTSATVAAAVAETADASPVPPALNATTTQLASSVASGAASAASGSTAIVLMEGVLTSMYVAKLKVAAAIFLALGLLGAGGGMLARGRDTRLQAKAAATQDTAKEQGVAAKADAKSLPAEASGESAKRRKALEIRDTLARTIKFDGIDDPKLTLADVLDSISAKYGISFHVNERAFAFEMVDQVLAKELAQSKPIPPTVATLATVLNRILDRITVNSGDLLTSRSVYLIRKDCVEITTGRAARADIGLRPEDPLLPLVYEHFDQTPLPDALHAVADHADVNIVIDPKCLTVISDTKVSAALHNVPVETAVRVLAQMGDLDVIRTANVYYVTSKGDAATLRKIWLSIPTK
jgi:RNA polymerase sigma factor (sigma-70 family)